MRDVWIDCLTRYSSPRKREFDFDPLKKFTVPSARTPWFGSAASGPARYPNGQCPRWTAVLLGCSHTRRSPVPGWTAWRCLRCHGLPGAVKLFFRPSLCWKFSGRREREETKRRKLKFTVTQFLTCLTIDFVNNKPNNGFAKGICKHLVAYRGGRLRLNGKRRY